MLVPCTTYAIVPGGSFINSETGEHITFSEKTECYVQLPEEPFPQKVFIKGTYPLGKGKINMRVTTKKDLPVVVFGDFVLDKA